MGAIASQITRLTIVYSTVYSGADPKKYQSTASLAFVREITEDRWMPRTNGQLRGKCFHLMTSSCIVLNRLRRLWSQMNWPGKRVNLCVVSDKWRFPHTACFHALYESLNDEHRLHNWVWFGFIAVMSICWQRCNATTIFTDKNMYQIYKYIYHILVWWRFVWEGFPFCAF